MLRSLFVGIALFGSAALMAKDQDKAAGQPRPQPFVDAVACKSIEDASARLACYDAKVSALDMAAANGDIILTDKAAIKEARRGLFGFTLPKIKIFGGDNDEEDIKEIEGIAESTSLSSAGKWLVVLQDGARWQQIDNQTINRKPGPEYKVRIRKAAMGSFFVNIDGAPAIRMKRVD